VLIVLVRPLGGRSQNPHFVREALAIGEEATPCVNSLPRQVQDHRRARRAGQEIVTLAELPLDYAGEGELLFSEGCPLVMGMNRSRRTGTR
jgi:hypothetical protein